MGLEVMFHCSHFQRFSLTFSSLFFLFLSLCFHPKFSALVAVYLPRLPSSPQLGHSVSGAYIPQFPPHSCFASGLSPLGIFATFS